MPVLVKQHNGYTSKKDASVYFNRRVLFVSFDKISAGKFICCPKILPAELSLNDCH